MDAFRRRDTGADRPLLLLLLPCRLEELALRECAEDLLTAPGALAAEPARVSYRRLGGLPPAIAAHVARRQARRMRLPGVPRAVAIFDELQLPLAEALVERHPGAEIWRLGGAAAPGESARAANRPHWERMEALGIESGRLGSERVAP